MINVNKSFLICCIEFYEFHEFCDEYNYIIRTAMRETEKIFAGFSIDACFLLALYININININIIKMYNIYNIVHILIITRKGQFSHVTPESSSILLLHVM